jgi:glyoxylase-like metal-dependent hydrolase (beta-lactamase superfamily II)
MGAKLCIETYPVGLLAVNCYLIHAEGSQEALIIDPGDEAEQLAGEIEDAGLKLQGILLTHGHFDHIGGVPGLVERYGVSVYIHPGDAGLYASPENCMPPWFGAVPGLPPVTAELPTAEGLSFQVLHTPGHTPGGVCFHFPEHDVVFSGDTLFANSVGRTDFPGGNVADLMASIRNVLFALPDKTQVLAGHNTPTSIGTERATNPFVR